MKTFNSIEELKPYYNKNTNTYEFMENGMRMNVEFKFNLDVNSHIYALNINAWNINAWNINASDIRARDIDVFNITAYLITALNINASDIRARDIDALNINASDINSWNINAGDISYYAVCFAYNNILCTSIKGRRANAKYFVLDGKITIKPKEEPKKKFTLELTDEQLEKVKEMLK